MSPFGLSNFGTFCLCMKHRGGSELVASQVLGGKQWSACQKEHNMPLSSPFIFKKLPAPSFPSTSELLKLQLQPSDRPNNPPPAPTPPFRHKFLQSDLRAPRGHLPLLPWAHLGPGRWAGPLHPDARGRRRRRAESGRRKLTVEVRFGLGTGLAKTKGF